MRGPDHRPIPRRQGAYPKSFAFALILLGAIVIVLASCEFLKRVLQ